MMACAFDALFLAPGHGHFAERLWICERGEAPSGLPRVGVIRAPRPSAEFFAADQRRLYNHIMLQGGGPVWAARVGLPFPQGRRSELLLWTEERVADELAVFLKGRAVWPKGDEFKRAGRDGLRKAIVRFGGMQRWAAEFELPMANFRGPHLRWTEPEIERAIGQLIDDLGQDRWPRRREFSRAGLDGCYAAMWRTGGAAEWAPRLGVAPPRRPQVD